MGNILRNTIIFSKLGNTHVLAKGRQPIHEYIFVSYYRTRKQYIVNPEIKRQHKCSRTGRIVLQYVAFVPVRTA